MGSLTDYMSDLARKYYTEDSMCLSDLILLLEEYEANRKYYNNRDKGGAMNIIGRLELAPLRGGFMAEFEAEELYEQRNKMLEALIDLTISQYHDNYNACRENGWSVTESREKSLLHIKEYTNIIESATCKTWEEIRFLLC